MKIYKANAVIKSLSFTVCLSLSFSALRMELEALLMSTAELHCNLYITEVTLRIQTLFPVGADAYDSHKRHPWTVCKLQSSLPSLSFCLRSSLELL